MKNWTFGIVTGVVVIAILVGAKFLPAPTGKTNNSILGGNTTNQASIDKVALAKYLTASGVKVYGAEGCHACASQKELFGSAWKYINYIECGTSDGTQAKVCKTAKITAYPTWEFSNGDKEIGVMTPDELAKKTNFKQ